MPVGLSYILLLHEQQTAWKRKKCPFVLSSDQLLPQSEDHMSFINVSASSEICNSFLVKLISSPTMNCSV